jgi:mono/diheme cytochrome c family protein
MISTREPVSVADTTISMAASATMIRMVAAAASLLMIGAFVGCGQAGHPTGGSSTTTPPPPSASSGTAGSTGDGTTGAAGVTTVPSTTGAAGVTTVPSTTGAAGIAVIPPDSTGVPTESCSTASTPGAAPTAYVSECSSCHGMTADGRNGYPSLRQTLTLADVTTIVRTGKTSTTVTTTTSQGKTIPLKMPAFSPARVSDADIAAIYAYRSTPTSANAPVPATYCLTRPEASWTPDQVTEAYTRGLKAWRTAGDVDQNACSSCHAADAMDLAFIGYSDSQIYRRAFSHINVTQSTIDDVIDMVHALRAKFNIVQPPNPATYRPFQPGGAVLAGASAAERDQAFGQELKDMGIRLMGDPINSVADAKQAWTELAGLNLRTLKVGIPMNKYTEDKFNNDGVNVPCPDKHMCDDHGTIADWITDTAVVPGAPSAAITAAQDAYLANPSLDTLKAVLLTLPRDETSWFKHKYSAVMIANFMFRQQAGGDANLTKMMTTTPVPFPIDSASGALLNSIWMVGANQRDFIHNVGATLPTGGGKFSVPAETLPGLTRNDANEQLQRIIVPWFWLGFTLDPSTMNVEPDYVAEGDEYFTQETFIDNGSSPIHGAFIVSKRSVEIMKYTTLPRSPNVFPFNHPDLGRFPVTPLVMRSGYFPIVTNFAEQKNFNTINNYQIMYTPTDATHKALYQTYAANQWRMFVWTLIGELQATPAIWNPSILGGKINKAEIFLTQPEVTALNGAQDKAMLAMARDLVSKATVSK